MDKIYGRNPVIEILKSEQDIDKLYINKENMDGSLKSILNMATKKKIVVSYVNNKKLDELCETTKHQGVVAVVPEVSYVDIEDILNCAKEKNEDPFIIILDSIEDPHNLGAIIRTANVAGAHGVIIPKRRSATVNGTVFKASAGAAAVTNICKVTNLKNAIDKLKSCGVWIYGADGCGEDLYFEKDLKGPIALVIGSEGYGMSKIIMDNCDFIVRIPVNGQINSLNASVATGVLAFEVVKQRIN